MSIPRRCFVMLCLVAGAALLQAGGPEKEKDRPAKSVEELAEKSKKSLVVVHYTGRDGQRQGLGTGFVVSSDGLIATNYHVIGEARPVTVQLANGSKHE